MTYKLIRMQKCFNNNIFIVIRASQCTNLYTCLLWVHSCKGVARY